MLSFEFILDRLEEPHDASLRWFLLLYLLGLDIHLLFFLLLQELKLVGFFSSFEKEVASSFHLHLVAVYCSQTLHWSFDLLAKINQTVLWLSEYLFVQAKNQLDIVAVIFWLFSRIRFEKLELVA
jgi:hypothetical protein